MNGKTMFGITRVRVKAIEQTGTDMDALNEFLKEHDMDIIDIQAIPMLYGVVKFIIIYQEA